MASYLPNLCRCPYPSQIDLREFSHIASDTMNRIAWCLTMQMSVVPSPCLDDGFALSGECLFVIFAIEVRPRRRYFVDARAGVPFSVA